MPGIYYELFDHKEPDLYVIKKRIVYSKDYIHDISIYYIIGTIVYMAPNFHKVISSKMVCYWYKSNEFIVT